MDPEDNSFFTNFCNRFLKSKKGNSKDVCIESQADSNIFKRFGHRFILPNHHRSRLKPTCVCTTTQSRKYEGLQERAGKEVFCKNQGTSGIPKRMFRRREEYDVYVVEEVPRCGPFRTIVNNEKRCGLDTNCNVNLALCKDSNAYGEPKPITGLKDIMTKVGTQMNVSFKSDSAIGLYCINAATQSRQCRHEDVRTGRATFCKDRQISCTPRTQKAKMEGDCYNVTNNQPLQSSDVDRKSLCFGSDCSFCFELYKDGPPVKPDISHPNSKNEAIVNKGAFICKFCRPWQAIKENKHGISVPNNSDACTCTDITTIGREDGQTNIANVSCAYAHDNKDSNQPNVLSKICEKCSGRPLHIKSRVNFDFKFLKTLPKETPPQETVIPQKDEECSCDFLNIESDIKSECDKLRLEKCDPCACKMPRTIDGEKSTKKCLMEFLSKKNFARLIKGQRQDTETSKLMNEFDTDFEKEELELERKEKEEDKRLGITTPETGTTTATTSPVPTRRKRAEPPFRIGSSYKFDFDTRKVIPKHKKKKSRKQQYYDEDPVDSNTPLKKNFFRSILGKIQKKGIPEGKPDKKRIPRICDTRKCYNRKPERNESWFSYILSNIKQERVPSTSMEDETKKMFTDLILSDTSTQSDECRRRCGIRKCPKLNRTSSWFSYITANLKNEKPLKLSLSDYSLYKYFLNSLKRKETIAEAAESDAEKFFSRILVEDLSRIRSCNCGRRKRRRKGRARRKAMGIPRIIGNSSSLTRSSLFSPSGTSNEDCIGCEEPTKITSECCFDANYNKCDDSDYGPRWSRSVTSTDSQESKDSKDIKDSKGYATT